MTGMELRVMAPTDKSRLTRALLNMPAGLGARSEAKPTIGGSEMRERVLTPRGSAAGNVG